MKKLFVYPQKNMTLTSQRKNLDCKTTSDIALLER